MTAQRWKKIFDEGDHHEKFEANYPYPQVLEIEPRGTLCYKPGHNIVLKYGIENK